ncbi:MAG: VCBS repeat-containing protein [Candidatus Aminicenantes bacterium]|jgi:hypothetical protein
MTIKNFLKFKYVLGWLVTLFLPGLFLLGANNEGKKPAIKKGAEVIVIKGTTRSWKDTNRIPLDKRGQPRRMRPVLNFQRDLPIVRRETEPDPVVQHTYTGKDSNIEKRSRLMPDPVSSFAGLNFSANGSGWPPDTNGDVGQTYYIQTVNMSIGIFRKSNGALVSATTFDDFFAGSGISGTPCEENNNGDPIVLYDRYAQRWFILDFAWDPSETDGSFYSIAVSKTSDPSGDWWLYALRADNTMLNDYPKAGIWHDGIYLTANMFQFTGGFQGVKVWALKKPDIYNGTLIAQTVYDTSWYAWSILPANAKGSTPPSSAAPNYMYSYDADEWGYSPTDVLAVWKYDVDWNNSANTTWTGPTTIPAAAFGLHSSNIPQQGTGNTLDALYDRLMYSAIYRNFTSYESVYLCHLVDVGGIAAKRWYEVRISGGSSSIYQQGTYAPDTHHRWMGSIAADKEGNIALGYSVSSSSMYPAVRYAGRLSTDPLNQLSQGEASLITGSGAQLFYDRWGDYSMMSIDPVDDETFWYTQQYYSSTGTNWQTRIGSFKLASGSPPPGVPGPDFNRDGTDDIIWRYQGSGGYNAVWLLGTGGAAAPTLLKKSMNQGFAGPVKEMKTGKPSFKQDIWSKVEREQRFQFPIKDGFKSANQSPKGAALNINPFDSASLSLREAKASSVTDPRNDPQSEELLAVADQNWKIAGTGDFNGDGNIDIVWSNGSTAHNCVWYMDGTTFTGYAQLPDGSTTDWVLGGVGDFDQDDNPDLIWHNEVDGRNGVWYLDGVQLKGIDIMTTGASVEWKLCGTGDFNSDGKVDVVWRNTTDGRNAVWYMDGVELSSVGWLDTVTNQDWKLRGTGDFNNDGKTDLIWTNISDGRNCIWYLDGVTLTGVEFITTVTDTTWKIEN